MPICSSSPHPLVFAAREVVTGLFDNPHQMSLVLGPNSELLFASPSLCATLGTELPPVGSYDYVSWLVPEEITNVFEQARAARTLGRPVGVYFRVVHQESKEALTVAGTSSPVPLPGDSPGEPGGLVLSFSLASPARPVHSEWSSHTSHLYAMLDEARCLTTASPAWQTLIGRDILGRPFDELVAPDDLELWLAAWEELLVAPAGHPVLVTQVRLRDSDCVLEIRSRNMLSVTGVAALVLDATDVTDVHRLRHHLEESEGQLRHLIAAMPTGLWLLDDDSWVTLANPALAQMLGHPLDDIIGRSVFDFADPGSGQDLLADLHQASAQGPRDVYLRHASGQRVETHQYATATPAGLIAMIIDVTEANQSARREHQVRLALEEATAARDEMFSRISHELRTPLHAIAGYSDLLDAELGTRSYEYKTNLSRAVEHLRVLIDDALEISSIQAESASLSYQRLSLAEVVHSAIALSQPRSERHFRVDIDPTLEVITDRTRLLQILVNLLSNAVKFSPEDSEVTITATQSDHETTFTVTDEGPGVPPEEVENIFRPFIRGRFVGATPGSGLGLSIVKAVVGVLGGSVWASGSTFQVSLPTGAPLAAPLAASPHSLSLEEFHEAATLVHLDDDPLAADLMRILLSNSPALTLHQTNTVTSTLALLETELPTLVILDLMLPDGSGTDVLTYLSSTSPQTPVIITTADARPETRARLQELGVREFLTKPFSQSEIAAAISRTLQSCQEDRVHQ